MSLTHSFTRKSHLWAYIGFFLIMAIGMGGVLLLLKGALWLAEELAPVKVVVAAVPDVKYLSDFLQAFGLLAAGLFFAYKLFTGWLIINLSVGIQTARQPHPDGYDLLVATVALDKGTTDTLWLTSVTCRVKPLGTPLPGSVPGSQQLLGKERYRVKKGRIDWNKADPTKGLTLSPGEKTSFAALFFVTPGCVYEVEAVVLGTRPLWAGTTGQWRAVAVVLPALPKKR